MLAAFVVGSLAFSAGWFGGGDVKLIAAACGLVSFPGAVSLVLYVLAAGALLALAVARGTRPARRARAQRRRGRRATARRRERTKPPVRRRDRRRQFRLRRVDARPGPEVAPMKNARRIPLIVGLLLALGTGVLLLNYLGSLRPSAAAVADETRLRRRRATSPRARSLNAIFLRRGDSGPRTRSTTTPSPIRSRSPASTR